MEKRLSEFFPDTVIEDGDPVISSLEYDSRKVKPGALYFALPGLHTDGHKYIGDAVERGAAAVVHEAETGCKKPGVAYMKVKNSRFAMSPVADQCFKFIVIVTRYKKGMFLGGFWACFFHFGVL